MRRSKRQQVLYGQESSKSGSVLLLEISERKKFACQANGVAGNVIAIILVNMAEYI